jgi:hypothetical protein
MHRLAPFLSLALAHLAACNPCTVPDSLQPGAVVARAGGSRWQAKDGIWFEEGTNVSIESESTDGWAISIVATMTDDGTAASEALAAEEFPIEFTVADAGAGAWALATPTLGGPLTSADAPEAGYLTIANRQEDDLLGCFAFDAGTGENTVSFVNGTFRIPERH